LLRQKTTWHGITITDAPLLQLSHLATWSTSIPKTSTPPAHQKSFRTANSVLTLSKDLSGDMRIVYPFRSPCGAFTLSSTS